MRSLGGGAGVRSGAGGGAGYHKASWQQGEHQIRYFVHRVKVSIGF